MEAREGNLVIKMLIKKGKPFIATKMGTIEQGIVFCRMARCGFDNIRWLASDVAGVSPNDDDTLNEFASEYARCLGNINILGLMDNPYEKLVISKYCPGRITCGLRCLEPFYFDIPWSSELLGKKVLVIHPFEESIINQYSRKELIFKDQNVLPDFELLTLKSEQTHGGGVDGSRPFFEGLDLMKSKMDAIDYDIALIGCGAYGLLLADHAKKREKQAVHIGGGLQILFGIKGGRWDKHPEISALYNEYWVRPLDSEKPRNISIVEGGTYW